MSKMSELALVLDEIQDAAERMVENVRALREMFSNTSEKESKKEITLEEVRSKLAELSRNDRTTEVKALLRKYGAEKLSQIRSEDYESLLKDAEEIENA